MKTDAISLYADLARVCLSFCLVLATAALLIILAATVLTWRAEEDCSPIPRVTILKSFYDDDEAVAFY